MAQSVSTTIGARSSALGNISSVLIDEWSILNNIGGLAYVKGLNSGYSYESAPKIPGSSRMAATFSWPIKAGAGGIGAFKFGDDIYSEQILTAGYSNKFGIASLGLKVNYIQYRADGFGIKRLLSTSVGGVATLTPKLSVGAYLQNINQPVVSTGERLPTRLSVGLCFKPIEQFLFITEVEKDLAYDPIIKAGIEYSIHKKVFARTGFNINPEATFIGIGFKSDHLKIDYALHYNNVLGMAHQISVNYQIRKKSNSIATKIQ